MSTRNSLTVVYSFIFLLAFCTVSAQSLVKNVKVESESATFEMVDNTPQSLLLEIAGPGDYYYKQEINTTNEINISNQKADGNVFPDGKYSLQVSPIFHIPEELLEQLVEMRNKRDALAIQKFRERHGLPENVESYSYNFSIKNGKFVYSNLNEKAVAFDRKMAEMGIAHPELYASVNQVEMTAPLNLANDNSALFAQVFTTDVVVQGSICVGFDCPSAPSFGFDTQRLQENNLRIHFDDTSNSAGFPGNDWRIVINDSSNGGRNYFAIQDATAGRNPFEIEAGAPANSLFVENTGDVGVGTGDPVVELHVRDGDTPTLRLEQDGSSGFTSQTWDVAGNETNFFVRDVNNGSKLPFKIKPGADDNALVIDNDNNIGIGILNATEDLHIFGNSSDKGNVYVQEGSVGINVAPSTTYALDVTGGVRVTGNPIITGTTTMRGDESHFLTTAGTFYGANFLTFFKLDATNGRVGIGNVATPNHLLELAVDDAAKPNGGMWTATSDRRLKSNIKKYKDGLDALMKINTVTYNYNDKSGYDTSKKHVGVIAQEIQEVAPYMVRKLNPEKNDYLAFEGTALTFMLVNAIQDQQKIIENQNEEIAQLSAQVQELDDLKEMVLALSHKVSAIQSSNPEEDNVAQDIAKDE